MNIAVCDDLPEYREKLKALLNPYISANQLNIAEFCRGEDLLDACEKGVLWDIAFLDIEMDGLTGIETGKRLRKLQRDVIVIFVTSHINYVSDAFRQDAFQFLLKPVKEEDFRKDFERALRVWKIAAGVTLSSGETPAICWNIAASCTWKPITVTSLSTQRKQTMNASENFRTNTVSLNPSGSFSVIRVLSST